MLSEIGERIFKMKYARDKNESWSDACLRVSDHVASAEGNFGADDETIARSTQEFYQLIYNLVFIPGGRILANAGTDVKNLYNCFVIGIDDSRHSIYQTLHDSAEVFAWGGGCGYNLSKIREEGALVNTTGGKASGPLSFMSIFDQTGEVISQASRRGAQLSVLNIDHPDIEKYIDFKSHLGRKNLRILDEFKSGLDGNSEVVERLKNTLRDNQLTHFNMSVGIKDDFMKAVLSNKKWSLISPSTKKKVKSVKARDLLRQIAQSSWESGDPGLIFLDRANEDNLVPYVGDLISGNPCSELIMTEDEACCLGSINLHSFYLKDDNNIDIEFLEYVVRKAVRFLDNVHELSDTPVERINKKTKQLRRIGIGVMGWADLLAELGIIYGSTASQQLAEYLSWFISYFAWLESMELGKERGSFPAFDREKLNMEILHRTMNSRHTPYHFDFADFELRNVSVTSIAPTGSIALLAGVNSSIEPFFSLSYLRYITEGIGNTAKDVIHELNPILFRKLEGVDLSKEERRDIEKQIVEIGSIMDIDLIPKKIRDSFLTSHELPWQSHVQTQASWQEFVSNSISKTINLPNSATVDEIEEVIEEMWNQDLKGGTIYRDGSKMFQILNKGSQKEE